MFKKKFKNDFTLNFAVLYFLHYLTASLINSQRMTFLIRTDYTISQRSLIFAAVPIVSIALQVLVGFLSDKYHTIKKIFIPLTVVSAITAYLFYSVQVQLFVFHFAITLLSSSLIFSMEDLSDVWVLESKGPSKDNYSFIRAFGSAGWAFGSFLLSQIVMYFGYSGLAITSLLFNILILAIILTIKDDKAQVNLKQTKTAINFTDIKEVFQNHTYLLAILIIFFIRFADNITGYILIDKMLELGGNEWHIGMRYVIAAGVEIPLLLVGDRIYKKLGSAKLIIISCVAYTFKFLGYYLADSNNIIFLVTILQAVALPFFIVATKYMLLELSPDHLKSTGQIVGPSIVNGIQGVLHPLVSGFLATMFSVNSPLLLATLFGVIAIVLSIPLLNKYKEFLDNKESTSLA